MEINSYKFSQLFQWLQFICTKQMHEFIFYSYFSSQISKFLIEKVSLKNKFENRFSKPKTGFRFENRKPDFRFLINIPNCVYSILFQSRKGTNYLQTPNFPASGGTSITSLLLGFGNRSRI